MTGFPDKNYSFQEVLLTLRSQDLPWPQSLFYSFNDLNQEMWFKSFCQHDLFLKLEWRYDLLAHSPGVGLASRFK